MARIISIITDFNPLDGTTGQQFICSGYDSAGRLMTKELVQDLLQLANYFQGQLNGAPKPQVTPSVPTPAPDVAPVQAVVPTEAPSIPLTKKQRYDALLDELNKLKDVDNE